MLSRDNDFCMSVGGDILFLQRVYDPDQMWFSFVKAVYPKVEPEVKEPRKKTISPTQRRSVVHWTPAEALNPQYSLSFIEGKRVTKGHRRQLHRAKFPTFERRPSGALYELAIKGELQGRKLRGSRNNELRKRASDWCIANCRGLFIPDRYFVFEQADDFALAMLNGSFFEQVKNQTSVV